MALAQSGARVLARASEVSDRALGVRSPKARAGREHEDELALTRGMQPLLVCARPNAFALRLEEREVGRAQLAVPKRGVLLGGYALHAEQARGQGRDRRSGHALLDRARELRVDLEGAGLGGRQADHERLVGSADEHLPGELGGAHAPAHGADARLEIEGAGVVLQVAVGEDLAQLQVAQGLVAARDGARREGRHGECVRLRRLAREQQLAHAVELLA